MSANPTVSTLGLSPVFSILNDCFFKLYFEIFLNLQNSCRGSTENSCILFTIFPQSNILHNHGTVIRPKKWASHNDFDGFCDRYSWSPSCCCLRIFLSSLFLSLKWKGAHPQRMDQDRSLPLTLTNFPSSINISWLPQIWWGAPPMYSPKSMLFLENHWVVIVYLSVILMDSWGACTYWGLHTQ